MLQRIQNACARFCFPIPRRAHVTPILNQNQLLKMSARRTLHFASLLFGVVINEKPPYLFKKLKFAQCKTRFAVRLICPQHQTAAFRGSFRYAATKCWNNLPPPIRNSKSAASFKRSLQVYLLNEQIANS